ncbi:MAG: hypothetical protein HY690_13030 [Chloroflexi bacterium]|nr:hypothetical protein [Chloroflexota bacterium]
MLFHLIPRRVVPTLVAAGLTVALSTALVAAEAGPPPSLDDHASPTAVVVANDDHGQPDTAGQPTDPGAEGRAHHANNGQGGGTDDGSSGGTNGGSSDDTTTGGSTNDSTTPGSAGGAGQPADPGSQGQAHHDNQGQTGSTGNSTNANSNNSNGQGHEAEHEAQHEAQDDNGHDCKAPFENHGEFVSCVARGLVHVAGANAQSDENQGELVREAAHSDTGKTSHATTNQGTGSDHGQDHGRGHKANH